MRICVFGAGAIGGFIAAFMARAGIDVSVIARSQQLQAIRANGITVRTDEETFTARVTASDDPAELGVQDGVLVTVKAPAQPAIARIIAPLLHETTPVAFLTNGVPWWYFHGHGGTFDGTRLPALDPGDVIWNAIGPRRTVGGIVWPASSVPEPGVIHVLHAKGRPNVLGTPDGAATPGVVMLHDAFVAAGLPIVVDVNIRDRIWEKLAFNLSAGPLCVLTETPVRATHEEAALIEASRRVVAETAALIAALGRDSQVDFDRMLSSNMTLGHRPSILQDLLAGRPMEVDALYNVPLQLARMVKVEMPTLEMLAALIRVKVRGRYA